MQFLGANPTPVVTGLEQLPGIVNYLLGDDPTKWRTNIPTYAKVQFTQVYPGIDLHYYGHQRQLEYDVIVAPGADPRIIKFGFKGHDDLTLHADGHLILKTAGGEVRLLKPHVYQTVNGKKVEVAANYLLQNPSSPPSQWPVALGRATGSPGEGQENSPPPHRGGGSGWGEKGHQVALQVGIQLAAYDHQRPLIIDPILSYATYLGGTGDDGGNAIAVDAAGNAYVTGYTSTTGSGFRGTAGSAIQSTYAGSYDVFVTKLNAAGTTRVYSTYLGGNGDDEGHGIAVDAAGNAYVTGYTSTTGSGFPGTPGSTIQPTFAGSYDAFVVKISLNQADTMAPTVPTGVAATASSATQVNVTWTASTDNVGVTGYQVERCQGAGCSVFTQIATPTGTSYSDTGLSPNTSYSYRVKAIDAAANVSAASAVTSVTTPANLPTITAISPTSVTVGPEPFTLTVTISAVQATDTAIQTNKEQGQQLS